MRRWAMAVLVAAVCSCSAVARPGKLVLQNGTSVTGDIQRHPDGSCWVTRKTYSLKYEAAEIRRVVIFSSTDAVAEQFVASMKITGGAARHSGDTPTRYDALIHAAAQTHHVDPHLVKAVIKAESGFNPADRSSKGACGLMQLMPSTARLLGVKDIYSPEENIAAGTRFLKDMLVQFNDDVPLALAAYNAGPAAVQRYRRIPPFKETHTYVDRVSRYYSDYRSGNNVRSYVDQQGCLTIYNIR